MRGGPPRIEMKAVVPLTSFLKGFAELGKLLSLMCICFPVQSAVGIWFVVIVILIVRGLNVSRKVTTLL